MAWRFLLLVTLAARLCSAEPQQTQRHEIKVEGDYIVVPQYVQPIRGNQAMYLGLPDMVRYKNEIYVRLYCTLIDSGDTGTEWAQSNKMESKFKNIVQQHDQTIVIKPHIKVDGPLITEKGYIFIGASDPRHQFQFLHRYNQRHPNTKQNHVIKSILVDLPTFNKATDYRYTTREDFSSILKLNSNVDIQKPNQFGFNGYTVDNILMPGSLPGSLVTFVQNHDSKRKYPPEWGTIIDVASLKSKNDMPVIDVPGIYNTGTKYDSLLQHLQKLKDAVQKNDANEIEIHRKKYEEAFGASIDAKDLTTHNVQEWIKETKIHLQLKSRNEQHIKVHVGSVPSIHTDFMFNGKTYTDAKIEELKSVKQERRENLKANRDDYVRIKAFETFLTKSDKELTKYFYEHFKGIQWHLWEKVGYRTSDINNIFLGYNRHFTMKDVLRKIENEIFNSDSKLSKVITSSPHNKQMKTFFYNIKSNVARKVIISFNPSKNARIMVSVDDTNHEEVPHILVNDLTEIKVDLNDVTNIEETVEILRDRVSGERIKSMEFSLKGLTINDDSVGIIVDMPHKMKLLISTIVISGHNGPYLEYDVIENYMREKVYDNKKLMDLGTPRCFKDGFLVKNDKFADRETIEMFKDIRRQNGVSYSGKDTLIDSVYNNMKQFIKIKTLQENIASRRIKKSNKESKLEIILRVGNEDDILNKAAYLVKKMKSEKLNVAEIEILSAKFANSLDDDVNRLKSFSKFDVTILSKGKSVNNVLTLDLLTLPELKKIFLDLFGSEHACKLLIANDAELPLSSIEKFGKIFIPEKNPIPQIRVSRMDSYDNIQEIMNIQYRPKLPTIVTINDEKKLESIMDLKRNDGSPLEKDSKIMLFFIQHDDNNDKQAMKLHAAYVADDKSQIKIPDEEILLQEGTKNEKSGKQYMKIDQVDSTIYTQSESKLVTDQASKSSVKTIEDDFKDIEIVNPCKRRNKRNVACNIDSDKLVPILSSFKEDNSDSVKGIAIDYDTLEKVPVKLKRNIFSKIKSKIHSGTSRFAKMFSGRKMSYGASSFGFLHGSYSFIDAAIKMSRSKRCKSLESCPVSKDAEKMNLMLKIEAYYNIADGAYGTASDIVGFAEDAIKNFKTSSHQSLSKFANTKTAGRFLKFTKVLGKVNVGVGFVGSIVGLSFSINQLKHAESLPEKVLAGLNVAFGAVSAVTSTVAAVAFIATQITVSSLAASISAAAGPIGLVVGFLSIIVTSITSLTFEFKNTRKQAQIVGEYFYEFDKVNREGGFKLDDNILHILNPAVVEKLDIPAGKIFLDSQYIYRTKHGRSGSGKKNYFFWRKHFPKMVKDKSKAINIRQSLGIPQAYSFDGRQVSVLILPVAPKSYISYKYRRLPFCTAFNDKGFSVLRRLENDYRFDYDFYIVPGEEIIAEISFEYVDTTMSVLFNNVTKLLLFPKVPVYMQGFYTYKFETLQCGHSIILQDGISVILKSRTGCVWNLDIKNVTIQTPNLSFNAKVTFGNTSILLQNNADKLTFIDRFGGSWQIDPWQKKSRLLHLNASYTSPTELESYLHSISQSVSSFQKYVELSSYKSDTKYIGKAFYEIKSKTILFSDFKNADVSNYFKNRVKLIGRIGNDVIYKSEENNISLIWASDYKSHIISHSFNLYCGNEKFEIGFQDNDVYSFYISQFIEDATLMYLVQKGHVTLVSVEGKTTAIRNLANTCIPSLDDFWKPAAIVDPRAFPGRCIYPRCAPELPLVEVTLNGTLKHFWLKMVETNFSVVTEIDHGGIFCKASAPPEVKGIIKPNLPEACQNITLRYRDTMSSGEEIYLFNCQNDKTFFSQIDDNLANKIFVPCGVDDIEYIGREMLVKSCNGGYYVFTNDGQFSLAGFAFSELVKHNNWTDAIMTVVNESTANAIIPILQMKTVNDLLMSAWYDIAMETLIIVSPSLADSNFIFVGETSSSSVIWLYGQTNSVVVLQHIMRSERLPDMVIDSKWKSGSMPEAKIVLHNVYNIEYEDGGVYVILTDGVMLHITYPLYINLLGVNSTWIMKNENDMLNKLQELCTEYNSDKLITLGYEMIFTNNTIKVLKHQWFHCYFGNYVSVNAESHVQPNFLGENRDTQSVFFLVDNDIVEYEFNGKEQRRKRNDHQDEDVVYFGINATDAKVIGDTFLLAASPNAFVERLPRLDGIQSLVLHTASRAHFVVKLAVWIHHSSIIVSSAGMDYAHSSMVLIEAPKPCMYHPVVVENDTVIVDLMSDRRLILEDYIIDVNGHYEDKGKIVLDMCDLHLILSTNRHLLPLPITEKDNNMFIIALVLGVASIIFILLIVFAVIYCIKTRRRKEVQMDVNEMNNINGQK